MPFLVIKSVLREAWTFVIKIILVFCLDVVQGSISLTNSCAKMDQFSNAKLSQLLS